MRWHSADTREERLKMVMRLVDTKSAAEYIGLAAPTLEQDRVSNRLKIPYLKIGRRVLYDLGDLDTFLDRCRRNRIPGKPERKPRTARLATVIERARKAVTIVDLRARKLWSTINQGHISGHRMKPVAKMQRAAGKPGVP
jgi:hypothetical protein